MAIQKKHGKGRLDKWYRLAKEKGYRARAAFKLIQLNKKYGFLEKSTILLDLCAAPGSWCQVAAECMPTQSIILGIDLAPIKAIPKVITLQSDITTDKCRASIRQYFKTWKADTVLHDGAPNVGTAWIQDAFSQAELVLQSMKLATEFLRPGGTFVTKIFRSKDYNSLLWVFKQLFTTVEATKPPSSRNVSAEIFVVCLGFKAPKHIDPKFLDPRHVFAELSNPTPNNEAKVFNPEKKKRKREGYEEGNYTQYKEIPVTEFINTTDPIAILANYNKLSFQQDRNGDLALATLDRMAETTDEVRMCCEDLKVLGKKEFRTLLKWRLKVRDIFGLSSKAKAKEDEPKEVAEVAPMDEELAIQEELQRQREKLSSKKKKERRRENEQKKRNLMRMQMNMTTPMDIGMEQSGPMGEGGVFMLKSAQSAGGLPKMSQAQMEAAESSEDEDDTSNTLEKESDEEGNRLEEQLDSMYERYQEDREDRDSKLRAKKSRKQYEKDEWEGFSDDGDKENESESDEGEGLGPVARPATDGRGLSNKAALFFDQDIFHDLDLNEEPDEEAEAKPAKSELKPEPVKAESQISASNSKLRDNDDDNNDEDEDEDEDEEYEPLSKAKNVKGSKSSASNDDEQELPDPKTKDGKLDVDIITAEAMTLAQQMATGEKPTSDVIDDGFNKHSFRDTENLPAWFLDDESAHSRPQRPLTAAAAAAIRAKTRALNARPIKKVLEAQGRRKMRAANRLEKMRRKSALLADDDALSEADKATTIARMMGRAGKGAGGKPKQKVQLVVAKGPNRGISGRPKGVKGKYKIVDARMKKDIRAQKRLAKKGKR